MQAQTLDASKVQVMMDRFCIELAANLTTQYFSPSFYDINAESLTKYLSKTGVLITMCIFPECDDLRPYPIVDHWSGSWLQESTTGVRVINNGGVGVVLNPEMVAPSCVYPIDGDSLYREGKGCGTYQFGKYTKWWEKLYLKAFANYRKYRYFPSTAWKDIPCSDFFEDSDSTDSLAAMIDHTQTWKSFTWMRKRFFEQVLGHTVCFDDTVPNFDDATWLLFAGDSPWILDQWNETMSTMKDIIDQYPSSKGIWNEVVFQMPPDNKLSREMIQAVFYYNSWFRDEATREAERLGNLPLLQLDPFEPEGKVFRCAYEGIEQSSIAL